MRHVFVLLTLVFVALCPAAGHGAESGVTFVSEGMRLVAHFETDAVRIVLSDGKEMRLPQVPSASGVRYTKGTVSFWTKGDEALLQWGEITYALRVVDPGADPWERAKAEGIDFRAIGQEPGWLLDIRDGERLWLTLDYGDTELTTPVAEPEVDDEARTVTYRTVPPFSPLDITVIVRRERCYDSMSGEGFPASVTVIIGGRGSTYHGCGRWLQSPGPSQGNR